MASAVGNPGGSRSRYGDMPYELERELREREFRHAGEARQEAVPVRRVAEQVRERQRVSVLTVVGFISLAVLAVLVLLSYVQLTEVSTDVVALKSQLDQLDADRIHLQAEYEEIYNTEAVKAAAKAAGMRKPSSSQIYYIDLSSGDSAEVYGQSDAGLSDRLLSAVHQGISVVAEYFD